MQLLSAHAAALAPGVRKSLVQALALLRSKDAVASAPCVAARFRQHPARRHRSLYAKSTLRPAACPSRVLELFFGLFRCHDKELREMVRWARGLPARSARGVGCSPWRAHTHLLQSAAGVVQLYKFIVSDIRAVNAKHKNNQLNRTLQNFMFSMLADEDETAARKSLDVMIELYKRRVWCAPRVRMSWAPSRR